MVPSVRPNGKAAYPSVSNLVASRPTSTREATHSRVESMNLTEVLERTQFGFATMLQGTTLEQVTLKTEGRISTICGEITMTIRKDDFRIDLAPNVLEPNDCFSPSALGWLGPPIDIACVSISRSAGHGGCGDASWACVSYAWSSIFEHVSPPLTCWLNACVVGEDSRLARHRGLWKALAREGLPSILCGDNEVAVEKAGGELAFYGATRVDGEAVQMLRPIVSASSRSFVTLLPDVASPQIELQIEKGWYRGLLESTELLEISTIVAMQKGVVLRFFGEFDDQEGGVDCLMSPDTYRLAISGI